MFDFSEEGGDHLRVVCGFDDCVTEFYLFNNGSIQEKKVNSLVPLPT